jgi:putative hemolysin
MIRRLDPARAAAERDILPQARMLELLREGAACGGLTAFQRDAFERVMSLSRTPVTRVMVPRQRAAMIQRDWSRADVLRIARMAHFSRLPVYADDARRVVGVLNVFDVLTDDQSRPTADYIRDVQRMDAGDTVLNALRTLQRAHEVMAIVCDARGYCLGLLTVKDLVEEIVGELEAW